MTNTSILFLSTFSSWLFFNLVLPNSSLSTIQTDLETTQMTELGDKTLKITVTISHTGKKVRETIMLSRRGRYTTDPN